ncbi:CBS domain-containing protein [Streptomyces sp. MJM1172]|uniref:CBS domain-containing protein n=1 Tax=Streptomyces sp. MJM1172 TaxID=1703926 RepID=UPI003FD31EF1
MTPDATCIGADDSILDAAKKTTDLGVGALPICGSDQLLKGMLTDRGMVVKVLGAGRAQPWHLYGRRAHPRRGRRYRRRLPPGSRGPWPSTRSAAVGELLEALSSWQSPSSAAPRCRFVSRDPQSRRRAATRVRDRRKRDESQCCARRPAGRGRPGSQRYPR